MSVKPPTQAVAVELLSGLVSIPSHSRQEAEASAWLVEQMQVLGYERAYVDGAGNAVGEMGAIDADRIVVLLGHIDTVPGNIPVRIEQNEAGKVLYGRGTVDAKGPLATFTTAVARLGRAWAIENKIRLVVVGAVEEESATSKGARFIRDRFNGKDEPMPTACIIGEPSHWRRLTLGYKGRILIELNAVQPMAHTAGPDAGVATVAVDFWNWVMAYAEQFNQEQPKLFDQLLPSLRRINTATDAEMNDRVSMQLGIRLPLDFDIEQFASQLIAQSVNRVGTTQSISNQQSLDPDNPLFICLQGPTATIDLNFYAHEPAWRSDRNNALVRSFLGAIRQVEPGTRPGFVSKTGTSDMNVVGPAWQCPILAYGPGDSALDHTPNEHLHLDEYWRAVQVLEQALRNFSSV